MADEPKQADDEKRPDLNVEPAQANKIFQVEKPLRYYGHEDITSPYAELAAIRHGETVFHLFFFQPVLPVTEDNNAIAQLDHVPARCILRVTMPPEGFIALQEAMGKNIEKWKRMHELREQGVEPIRYETAKEEDKT